MNRLQGKKKSGVMVNLFGFLLVAFFVLVCVTSIHAHNLWIVGDADNNGEVGTVHLYFEHHVGPGDGAYLGPIEERGKTWLTTFEDKSIPLAMEAVIDKETKYLSGRIDTNSESYAIDHTSIYGIYHGRLDFFHGRYLKTAKVEDLAIMAESQHLPVQVVPVWTEEGLLLRVMYFSTPKPSADLFVLKKDGTEESFTTNKKGEFLLGRLQPGTYYIGTRIIESEPAGAFEYQAYRGIMHVSTLTLTIGEGFVGE